MTAMPTPKRGHGRALDAVIFIPSNIGRSGNKGLERLKLPNSVIQHGFLARARGKDVQVISR